MGLFDYKRPQPNDSKFRGMKPYIGMFLKKPVIQENPIKALPAIINPPEV